MSKSLSQQKVSIIIFLELFVGIGASVFSLFLFIVLAANIEALQVIDSFLNVLVYETRTPELTSVMQMITYLGQEALLIILVMIFLLLVIKKHGRAALVFVLIFSVGVGVNLLLKEAIGRARPTLDPLIVENFYSFPSGHAMNAFVFYTTLVLYVYRFSRSFRLTILSLVINWTIVLLVGVSRVYLGVHYVSDIFAGLIAGLWWIATALVIEKTLFIFWRRKRNTT